MRFIIRLIVNTIKIGLLVGWVAFLWIFWYITLPIMFIITIFKVSAEEV